MKVGVKWPVFVYLEGVGAGGVLGAMFAESWPSLSVPFTVVLVLVMLAAHVKAESRSSSGEQGGAA